jgi:hypothetical protein
MCLAALTDGMQPSWGRTLCMVGNVLLFWGQHRVSLRQEKCPETISPL